jgi:hypothetical protein
MYHNLEHLNLGSMKILCRDNPVLYAFSNADNSFFVLGIKLHSAAKKHVTRNKAAYIAGSAGLAAGAVGGAVAAKRKKAQNQD